MDEWGKWDCPACGVENEDPDCITEASCGLCGTLVTLSPINDNGLREVYNIKGRNY